ncbi:MAG: ATP-binding protein [Bacteroidota bacterium]
MKNRTEKQLLEEIGLLKQKIAKLEEVGTNKERKKDSLIKNEQLDLILQGANIGWCDWQISSGKETYNDILPKLLGYKHSEMKKTTTWWETITHPDDLEQVKIDIQNHFDGKTEFYVNKHRLKTSLGEWKWYYEHGKVIERDKDGKAVRMIVTLRDIDKQHKAETAVQISENKFRTIFENAPILIDSFDKDGKCILWNKECEKTFGWTIDEINSTQNTLALFYHDEDEYNRVLESINIEPDGEFREWHPYTKRGTQLTTKWANFRIAEGVVINMGYDITKQKELEAEQKQSRKEIIIAKEKAEESDKLKTAFLQNLSHEIRTPLNGILGFTDLIKLSGLTPEELGEYIGIIEESGTRLLNTINDLMDISMITSGQIGVSVSDTNMEKLMTGLFSKFKNTAQEKGIHFIIDNLNFIKDIVIKTDTQKIRVILSKLISNAIKFTKHGSVEVGFTRIGNGNSSYLKFYVIDTGIGIPPNRLELIFDRFMQVDYSETRDFEGSGLGLSIIKAYVEMLNGKIWVKSEIGVGSQFYFTIKCNMVK